MKTQLLTTNILIVDDQTSISQTLVRILDREFGTRATVVTCSSAEDALLRLKKSQFDLLITDWDLPGMSGGDLTTQVHDLLPHLKVILMTGSPTFQINRKARGYADVYVTKPFRLPDLLRQVHNLLR